MIYDHFVFFTYKIFINQILQKFILLMILFSSTRKYTFSKVNFYTRNDKILIFDN